MSNDLPDHPLYVLKRMRDEQRKREAATRRPTSTPPSGNVTPLDDERAKRYAARALDDELDRLAHAVEGERNDTLNRAAFSLGQLVAAGLLDGEHVRYQLTDTARRIGLDPVEIDKTIASGFRAGSQHPREITPREQPRPAPPAATTSSAETSPDARGASLPPDEPPDDDELAEFWNARELLTHVQHAARARRTSPWAVLSVVLARIVTATPYTIVLPPLVGGVASLNLFVGLVGASGTGKGAAERVASECFQLGRPIKSATPGSGEGLVDAYRKPPTEDDDGWLDEHHAVLFTVPEIDTLTALGSRQGSTLMPELRRAWSGESLGHHYRDRTKRTQLDAQLYRLTLVAGIQPERAKTLLDDADGGTPQRFIWASALDPDAPEHAPTWPEPLRWHAPSFQRPDLRDPLTGRYWMGVPDIARDTIDAARLARVRGEGDALDGHLLLARLKIAAAFAIADSRLDIYAEDWQLADVLTRKSNATRTSIVAALERDRARRNRARAIGDAERAVIVDDMQLDAARRRIERNIMRKLSSVDDLARTELRNRIAARDRGLFDEVVDELIETGRVRVVNVANGVRYARV